MDLLYPTAGAITGFIVGLTGVGGGALMTPILLLLFGIAPTTAVATDLWFATLTKLAALCIHHREQQVDWQIVRRLWAGSLPGASLIIVCLLTGILSHLGSGFLTKMIGFVILTTSISLLFKSFLKLSNSNQNKIRRYQLPLTVGTGLMLGILVALTSVGAGAIGSIVLLYLYPSLTANKLVGTDIAHAIPLALVAGIGYLLAGHVNLNLLFSLILGSLPAALLGSTMAARFSHKKLKLCLVAVLSMSGFKLIF